MTASNLCAFLALVSGCATTSSAVAGASDVQRGHSYLLCVDEANDPAIAELKLAYSSLVIGRAPDRAECVKARLITESVANNCLDRSLCTLPRFIDGMPTDIPEAPVDRVLVISELHIDNRVETTKEARANNGSGPATAGRSSTPTGRGSTTLTKRYIDPAGRTGPLFIYNPRVPQIVGAANASNAPPRELARTFTRMEKAARITQ